MCSSDLLAQWLCSETFVQFAILFLMNPKVTGIAPMRTADRAILHPGSNVSNVKRKDLTELAVVEVLVAEGQEIGLVQIRIVARVTSRRVLSASNARRRDPKELAAVHHLEGEEDAAASEDEVGALGTGAVEATLHAKGIGPVQMPTVEQAISHLDLSVSNVKLKNQVAAVALVEEGEVDVGLALAAEEAEAVDAIREVAGASEGQGRAGDLTPPLHLRTRKYPSMIRVYFYAKLRKW